MTKKKSDLFKLHGNVNLSPTEIEKLAWETEFRRRSSGKISAPDFLLHMCLESLQGTVSYNDLAARIESQTGTSASRQAYWERTNGSCLLFFQRVLERVMHAKYHLEDFRQWHHAARFKRILLQDSTVIQLPLRLFEAFSGVRNAHATVCNARIQGIYDLIAGRFIKFSVDSYSKNDLAATLEIPVKKGDLVLRDRGYFAGEAIVKQKEDGADTISRYKHRAVLFDKSTGQEMKLLELLSQNASMDREVLIGTDKKLKARIVAVAVDEETANLRRMKAKRQACGHNPSKDILRLMSWTIFITTISDAAVTFKDILMLYGLRWRIENIFKTWKSNFNFTKIHNVSLCQLRILLTARFIMFTIFYQNLHVPLARIIREAKNKQLSLMKLMRYISKNPEALPQLLDQGKLQTKALDPISRYCTYDKRNRMNFVTKMEIILTRKCLTSSLP